MTEEELLKEYPILTDKDFRIAKRSICNLIGKDEYTDDRGRLTEYCNETSDNNDEMFFYEMLRALEFILENATAYTTPDKRICLNYPCENIVPMDSARYRRWYFVYCHECLHQLWDTFAVADQIKKDLGECNFELLNIASDCVINEYLAKDMPDGKLLPINVITADFLKKRYGVEYSRRNDTQYSLYLKLLELSKEQQDDLCNQGNQGNQQGNQGNQQGNQGNKQGNQQGNQGNQQGNQGNKQGNQQGNQQSNQGNQQNDGSGNDDNKIDRELIEENRAAVEKILKKYSQSLSGGLKDFLEKCKASKDLEAGGLLMQANKGGGHWNKELQNECDMYIRQRLQNRDKKYKKSRKRFKRGETPFSDQDFKNGRILNPGKEEIKDQIGFDMALYIDVSGSMSGCIDRVFDTAYNIVATIKKLYSHDKLVDANAINIKSYVFTEKMYEIPFGKKVNANGGTYSFNNLLDDIYKRNANAFLNIVISDGDFSGINVEAVKNALDNMDGLFVLVTNKPKGYFTDLVNTIKRSVGPKLVDIYADADFTVS